MAAQNYSAQLLEELESFTHSPYQIHQTSSTRRTASFALPPTSLPFATEEITTDAAQIHAKATANRSFRRMSLSPWRSRPKLDHHNVNNNNDTTKLSTQPDTNKLLHDSTADKKRIWNWKPIRALSHIVMQKLSCLFSVEVVTVQGLPASMNGLRLSACVRKRENKDGSVHTLPSRVSQGAADFEETMFLKCHVYCSPGNGHGKQLKFEPRPFWIYVLLEIGGEEEAFLQHRSCSKKQSFEKNRNL